MGSIVRSRPRSVEATVGQDGDQWVVAFSVLREYRGMNLDAPAAAVDVVKWFHGLDHEQVISVKQVRTNEDGLPVYKVLFEIVDERFDI